MFRIQHAQKRFEDPQIGEELLRELRDIEHKGQVVDSRCAQRMRDDLGLKCLRSIAHCVRGHEAVDKGLDLPGEVPSRQHGDLSQILRGIGRLLPLPECGQIVDDLLPLV